MHMDSLLLSLPLRRAEYKVKRFDSLKQLAGMCGRDLSSATAMDIDQTESREDLDKIIANSNISAENKQRIYDERARQAVSSSKSYGRSSPPEPFRGQASDQGQPAQSWLYSVELYFAAEYTPNPVSKAVTYLHDDARTWWQQSGSTSMPAKPTFADFSPAFLARYVKPADSAKAGKSSLLCIRLNLLSIMLLSLEV